MKAPAGSGGSRPSLLLPAVAAPLLVLAQPPLDLPALSVAGLVVLATFLLRCDASPEGGRRAVRGSALLGLFHWGLALHWMPLALSDLSWLAVPGWVVVCLGLSAVWVAVGWLVWAATARLAVPVWVALPVAWTAGEWLRGNLPLGLSFPWLELGVSLTAFPRAAGFAEVVGSRGLGFWMALAAGLVAAALDGGGGASRRPGRSEAEPEAPAGGGGRGHRRRALLLAATGVVVLLPGAWGVWRAATLEVRAALPMAVVQPGVGPEERLEPAAGWAATRDSLDAILAGLAPGEVELVALPEAVFRGYPEEAGGRAALGALVRQARRLDTPLVFGAYGRPGTAADDVAAGEGAGAGAGARYNSAFRVGPEGLEVFRYDKRRLVPGVERVPLGMAGLLSEPGDFGAGTGAPLLEVGDVRLGVLICYESLYPELARGYRRDGADLLLNLTNDGWFGGAGGRPATWALVQHPRHLVLRALEMRVGVARAAATGVSLYVDPLGGVHEVLESGRSGLRIGDPGTTDVLTLQARWGDWVGGGSALLATLLALAAWHRGRTRPSLDPSIREH